jgi:hypothetical protein
LGGGHAFPGSPTQAWSALTAMGEKIRTELNIKILKTFEFTLKEYWVIWEK